MDEEDLIESRNKFTVPKVKDKRFKIDFAWIFILCVGLMIADQIIKYVDYLPELFDGADYIFHIVQSAVIICAQLSVSVAAAVIFYYVLEFINTKKRINDITEIRKYMLFILYHHMNIICHTESFGKLNRDKKRLDSSVKMFLTMDIPILLDCYNSYNQDSFSKELHSWFLKAHNSDEGKRLLILDLKSFQKEIDKLVEYKRFPFYKGYTQDIEGVQSLYEEISEYTDMYKCDSITDYFEPMIDYYISFLDDCIHVYHIMERYVECLEEKRFFEFIKMMD